MKENFYMDKVYQIARDVFIEKLKQQTPFTYEELENEVIAKGGLPAWDFSVTLGCKIADLHDEGFLEFDRETEKYIPPTHKQIKEYLEARKQPWPLWE